MKNGYKSFGANCRIVQDQRHCTGAFNTQILIPHTATMSFACDFGSQKRFPCGFALYGAVRSAKTFCFQEECWWDCEILPHPLFGGQFIVDLECLKDCFDQISDTRNRDTSCLISLIEDVTTKGTCEVDEDSLASPLFNPAPFIASELGINVWGWTELDNDCTIALMSLQYEILNMISTWMES